jgi:hypothetical protein
VAGLGRSRCVDRLARASLALSPVPFAVALGLAQAATPGAGAGDFVSELGVPGAAAATTWNAGLDVTSALLLCGAGLGRGRLAGGWPVAAAVGALGLAVAVARVAPCSARCPIPLVDPAPTASDVVHVAASSVGLLAAAAGASWLAATAEGWWAWLHAAAAAAIPALSLAFLAAVAAHARPCLGLTERALFGVVAVWVCAVATTPAGTPRPR